MNRRVTAVLYLAVALALIAGGCSASGPAKVDSRLRGMSVDTPLVEPALNLTDQYGRSYDLRARTEGALTLLYFGYTHCPDECPTTMADLAAALRRVSGTVRDKVVVVFVTSDPARDTPAVIRRWLAQFSSAFVGLTGDIDTIYAAAAAVGVNLVRPKTDAAGTYQVEHGTQVLAFGMDRRIRQLYADGTLVGDYVHDLPLLTRGD